MKNVKNLKIMAAVQALLMSGVTLSALSACDDSSNEIVMDNQNEIVEILDDDVVETTYVSDVSETMDSTTTFSSVVSDDKIVSVKVTDKNEDSEIVVNTTVEEKNSGSKSGNSSYSNSGGSSNGNSGKSGNTGKDTSKSSGDTTKKTTAKTTAAKTTTKPVTTKTTVKTTTKPVTTKITTVTEAKTEPVTEPIVEPITNYDINDICYDADAFEYFAERFGIDFKTTVDGTYYDLIGINGNYTNFYLEGGLIIALLNDGYINENVLSSYFSKYSKDDVYNAFRTISDLNNHEEYFNIRMNFEKYCCDNCKDIGRIANSIQDSYFNGTFNEYCTDQLINGNIGEYYLSKRSVSSFFSMYNDYLLFYEDESSSYWLEDFESYLETLTFGESYIYH